MSELSVHTTGQPGQASRRVHPSSVALSLVLALAIVAGAWYIGGRAGFDEIGRGGINQRLLPRPGEPAPDFTVIDLRGNVVSLSDYRGRPVWLNFWGAWCPPCRAEMPDIQTAYEQLAPRGLVLLAVSLGDPPDQAAEFAARNNVTFTVLLDPYRTLTGESYPIYNFPTHIFIDEDGIVRKVVLSTMTTEQAIEHAESVLGA